MGKLTVTAMIMAFSLLCHLQQKQEQHQHVNPMEAKQVLLDYFDAIADRDYEGMRDLSTLDYLLFENGSIWNNDSLITLFKSMPQATIEYEFSDINVETDCKSAYLNYRLRGILTVNDTTQIDYRWIESSVVKKVGNELKLDFLHSTEAEKYLLTE